MAEIFCSRVEFTLLGAPQSSFFIESLKSVTVREHQQNAPLSFLSYRPVPYSYVQSFSEVSFDITYYITDSNKTFDFAKLPWRLANGQLILYKRDDTIAVINRVFYDGWSLVAAGPNEPTLVQVSFLATDVALNSFI